MVSREGTAQTTSEAAETQATGGGQIPSGVGTGERQTAAGSEAAQRQAMTPELALEMRLLRNLRYHEDRQGHFDAWNRRVNFAVLALGSAAAATALSTHPHLAVYGGAFAAAAGAAQLVFDFGGKARTHLELRRSFARLYAKSVRAGADVQALHAEMTSLYADEPELFHAVNAMAYNAAELSYGRSRDDLLKVAPWRAALRHYLRFDPADFPDARPA